MQLKYSSPIIKYLLKTCLIALFSGFNHWSSNVAIAQSFLPIRIPAIPSSIEIRGIVNQFGLEDQNSGLIKQFIQFSKNDSERIPILPNEIDITQRSVIWLSCKPGGPKANNTLSIHRPTMVQPSEILLAESAIWRDMRLTSTSKHSYFMRIHQRRPKRLQNYEVQSARPKVMQATGWIQTKDNKILLTDGKPVKQFSSSRLSPDSCHSR
ncbi:hypothetical protein HRE53_32015 (plasmid) [Acaryochloris sp. 'Moss Beach']|uniref:hypothetical protein n=1 Tax=Acaryochloris sp. 'Moss Beach' TaxID=2740837 RepID=UPI001F23F720|nr:hypothetical protein [Acaryochloris sp. 'Moss Beach']UJB73197.1 hypothetical protein HRE53_32015 [Acaryochloris sp. 'Moss Beach']